MNKTQPAPSLAPTFCCDWRRVSFSALSCETTQLPILRGCHARYVALPGIRLRTVVGLASAGCLLTAMLHSFASRQSTYHLHPSLSQPSTDRYNYDKSSSNQPCEKSIPHSPSTSRPQTKSHLEGKLHHQILKPGTPARAAPSILRLPFHLSCSSSPWQSDNDISEISTPPVSFLHSFTLVPAEPTNFIRHRSPSGNEHLHLVAGRFLIVEQIPLNTSLIWSLPRSSHWTVAPQR
jgi:hypothetical protein